jgi:D-serine deaminase-like pyridoxal phosphate-dependent protein
MTIHDLDTPAMVLDLDRVEHNVARVAEYARRHGLNLRPHTKTHKIPALARLQLAHGAIGLTVAKPTEAEVMAESGVQDLLVAYPVLGRIKVERLVRLLPKTRVTVALDSVEAAEALRGTGIDVLVEVDVGLRRVGVQPGPELLKLVEAIRRIERVRYRGVAFYPGHMRLYEPEPFDQLRRTVAGMVDELERAGHKPEVVSGGSTPLLFESHHIEGLTEIRPGTSIFNDRNCVGQGVATWSDCAASLLVTVVSSNGDRMMIDGGSKTFSSDGLSGASEQTYGRILECPDARFHKMNEEHGFVEVKDAGHTYRPGARLSVIPNHICVAMNLQERVYGVRAGHVEAVWVVAGRGKLQ